MGSFITVIGSLVVGTCLLSMNLLIVSLLGLLRNLPAVFNFFRRVLGWLMFITFSLYRPILIYLQPLVFQYLGINILQIPARITSSILLSLGFLLLIHFATSWHISALGLSLAALHGFSVGLIWDEIGISEGLHVGERIE